ncbi:MAG: hypothetical protein QM733_21085 [Ilumatobacteraceae bacterium]
MSPRRLAAQRCGDLSLDFDPDHPGSVVHDVFVGLQRHVGNVANPIGYLHRSVVRRSISFLRRRCTSPEMWTSLVPLDTT